MQVQLYAVEGSSYDGCNGSSSWIMKGSITNNKDKAYKYAKEYESTYVSTEVVKYKKININ
jgi:hypothetical protein